MDIQAFLKDLSNLGGTAIGPLKSVITVLAQIMIQILQFITELLKMLVTKM